MTELFLELVRPLPDDLSPESLVGVSGLVVDGSRVRPEECGSLQTAVMALTGADGEGVAAWCETTEPVRVIDGGLDACARLRDTSPELSWMPRLTVYRPEVRYRMTTSHGAAGFKFYAPDTGALRGYRVSDGDLSLQAALNRARELGFDRLWLHARHAAEQGRGLDLDLLERARRVYEDGLWFSGGAAKAAHLENLARAGGVDAVVVGSDLLAGPEGQRLADALAPPAPPEQPIHFRPRGDGGCAAG